MSKKVSLARVDKELLRATTNMNWNLTAVDYVAVVGADYVNDPFTESIMQLCLPNIIRVKILRKEDLSAFLQKDEGRKEARVMIIFKDLATAEQCIRRGCPLEELQVPYPPVEVGGKKKLSAYFNAEEIECIRRIQGCGTKLYFQTLPYQAKDYGSFV